MDCADLISAFSVRSCCFLDHDFDLALALFLVIREEARFCGRSFQARPETLRPLVACRDMDGSDFGSRILPGRYWFGVVIGSIVRGMMDVIICIIYYMLCRG